MTADVCCFTEILLYFEGEVEYNSHIYVKFLTWELGGAQGSRGFSGG